MLGAGATISQDALTHFAGRNVTVVGHPDEAGRAAAMRWAQQIKAAGGIVRAVQLKKGDLCDIVSAGQLTTTSSFSDMKALNELLEEIPLSEPPKKAPSDARAEIDAALRAGILPCTELSKLGIPPRQKLLGDWFFEGDLGFIFAPRGVGKTWLALAMATAIARGGKCGRWQASSGNRVLYIDGEMPCEELVSRIEGMSGDENLTVLNHEALFHLKARRSTLPIL